MNGDDRASDAGCKKQQSKNVWGGEEPQKIMRWLVVVVEDGSPKRRQTAVRESEIVTEGARGHMKGRGRKKPVGGSRECGKWLVMRLGSVYNGAWIFPCFSLSVKATPSRGDRK